MKTILKPIAFNASVFTAECYSGFSLKCRHIGTEVVVAKYLLHFGLAILCCQFGCSTTPDSKPFRLDSYMKKVKEAESSTSPQFVDTSKASNSFSLKRSARDYMTGSTQHAKDVTSQANKMVHGDKPSFFDRFRKSKPKIVTKFNEKPIPQTVDAQDPTSLQVPKNVSPNVYLTAAAVSEHQGAIDKAITQYNKLLEVDPNHRQGLIRLARVLHSNGRMQESIATYQRAAAAYPNDAVILNDLGLCLARSGRQSEAVEAIRKAGRLDPTNVMYGNNLAAVLVESNRVDAAIDVLSQKHGPAIAHYNVGYMLNQQGEVAAATEHFSTSLRFDPNLRQAQQMLDQLAPMVTRRPSESARAPNSARPVTHQSEQSAEQSFYYPETTSTDVNDEQLERAENYQDSLVPFEATIPSESYVASDLPLGLETEPAPVVNATSLKESEPELISSNITELPRKIGETNHRIAQAMGYLSNDNTDEVMQTAHLEPFAPVISQPNQLKILGHDKSEAIEPPLPMEWK